MALATILNYHEDLRSAFRAAIKMLAAAPPVAFPAFAQAEWENEKFSQTMGTPWMRERQVIVSSIEASKGVQEHLTLCSLTLFFPAGAGTRIIGRAAGYALGAFPLGTRLQYGDTSAWCIKAERKTPAVEVDWVQVPIVITTRGHTYS